MKLLDYNEVLQDFQYKPNVAFRAYEREGRWWIRVIMLVENARAPFKRWELTPMLGEEIWFSGNWVDRIPPARMGVGHSPSREMIEVVGNYTIPPFSDGMDLKFIDWLVFVVRKMEDHEMYEWLRYKGELINDPHKMDRL